MVAVDLHEPPALDRDVQAAASGQSSGQAVWTVDRPQERGGLTGVSAMAQCSECGLRIVTGRAGVYT